MNLRFRANLAVTAFTTATTLFGAHLGFGSEVAAAFRPSTCISDLAPAIENSRERGAFVSALQSANWEEIYRTLSPQLARIAPPGAHSSPTLAPTAFVLAHAALAAGENDKATKLFYLYPAVGVAASPSAFTIWKDWTLRFVFESGESPISLYFHADALVRSGDPIAAQAVFRRVLESDLADDTSLAGRRVAFMAYHALGNLSLTLSGRVRTFNSGRSAVGNAAISIPLGSFPAAYSDQLIGNASRFCAKALSVARAVHATAFSDPHNTLGLYTLLSNGAPERAREEFERALVGGRKDSMATNGAAFAMVLGGARKERILQALESADSSLPFVAFNRDMIARGTADHALLDAIRGGFSGGSITAGASFGFRGLGASLSATASFDRGGAFAFLSLDSGGNLSVRRDAKTEGIVLGHWLVLNYPSF